MRLLPLLAGFALQGCFDSQWGEAKRVQQANAAHATPATIHAAPVDGAGHREAARSYRVRIYATPSYAARMFDWKRRMNDVIGDANRVLGPILAVRLEIESCHDWAAVREDDLVAPLQLLETRDTGADVDWVIGMVGGLPRMTNSFHDLGMSRLGGKHIVLRAAGDAEEEVAIERNFDELKEEDRAQLVRARKRHRATAVLLHEIGHTLEATHVKDARSLMSPQYNPHMEAYGEASTGVMRATLVRRNTPAPAAPVPAAPPEKPLPADVQSLPESERALFARVLHTFETGDAATARAEGRPLFESRLDVYSVQDLRCKIALAQTQAWATARAECDPLMKVAAPPAK